MFLFKALVETLKPKKSKSFFEPLLSISNHLQLPSEIKQSIKNMSRCSHCHFLIFDNYWSNEVERSNIKVCPTCGSQL